MERQPVKSSSIKSVGYSAETYLLEVEFTNGAIYQHSGVTPELYKALMTGESIGKSYGMLLRNRYQCRKVAPVTAEESKA